MRFRYLDNYLVYNYYYPEKFIYESDCLKGGVELPPVNGHLGSNEPIVKPTWMKVGFFI